MLNFFVVLKLHDVLPQRFWFCSPSRMIDRTAGKQGCIVYVLSVRCIVLYVFVCVVKKFEGVANFALSKDTYFWTLSVRRWMDGKVVVDI